MKTHSLKTPQQIREEWNRKGISQNSWAKKHGFPIGTVSQVMNGRNSCRLGVGHKVAVSLGIKEGEIATE